MVMGDSKSKAYYGAIHPQKGCRFPEVEIVVAYWVEVLESLGYRRVTMRSDNEPSIVAFLEKLKGAWPGEVVAESSSVGDPQSNGAAEAGVGVVKGLIRTNKLALEGKLGQTIADDHPLLQWIVRYSTAVYRRYKVGPDGATPYERLVQRKCSSQAAEFGEHIWYTPQGADARGDDRRRRPGFYLGPVDGRRDRWVADDTGMRMSRDIGRRPWDEKWDTRILTAVKTGPFRPYGGAEEPARMKAPVRSNPNPPDPEEPRIPPVPEPRRVRLTKPMFAEKYGWTVGCDECDRLRNNRERSGRGHSEACRQRIEGEMRKNEADKARLDKAANKFAEYAEARGEDAAGVDRVRLKNRLPMRLLPTAIPGPEARPLHHPPGRHKQASSTATPAGDGCRGRNS